MTEIIEEARILKSSLQNKSSESSKRFEEYSEHIQHNNKLCKRVTYIE